MPSMAQVKPNSHRNAAPAKSSADGADMSQFKMNRKAYIDEVTKSFDALDTNHDGYIDAQEMAAGNEREGRNPNDPLDDSELDSAKEAREFQQFQAKGGVIPNQPVAPRAATPAPASKAVSPVTGIPPINSDQLLKK
jgi:hypothetical protein